METYDCLAYSLSDLLTDNSPTSFPLPGKATSSHSLGWAEVSKARMVLPAPSWVFSEIKFRSNDNAVPPNPVGIRSCHCSSGSARVSSHIVHLMLDKRARVSAEMEGLTGLERFNKKCVNGVVWRAWWYINEAPTVPSSSRAWRTYLATFAHRA